MIDYPYIILMAFLLLNLMVAKKYPLYRSKLFYISCWVTFLFIALRAKSVGADTEDYVNFFTGMTKQYNSDQRELEPLLLIYNGILQRISRNGVFYLVMNTLCSLWPVYYIIKKYSFNPILSIILFFILGLYGTYFVALRQILSISLILIGFILFQKNENKYLKWGYFLLFSVLAYFMHTTALPVSLIFICVFLWKEFSKKISVILIISSFLLGYILKDQFYMYIFSLIIQADISAIERISYYLDVDNSFDSMNIITLSLPTILALSFIKYVDHQQLNHDISKLYIIGCTLNNMFMFFAFAQRLSVALLLFSTIAVTWPIANSKARNYRLVLLGFVILFTIRFILGCINYDKYDLGRMHPYTFFFQ